MSARSDRALTGLSRWVGRAHVRVLRATRWRVGARWMGGDVVVLHHIGRRSGRVHTTPLLFVRDGDAFVVAASNGGIDHEPQWWLNLQAEPHATVEVRGATSAVVAAAVEGVDRERLWGALMARYAGYDRYQAGVTRTIAVVRLAPAGAEAAA